MGCEYNGCCGWETLVDASVCCSAGNEATALINMSVLALSEAHAQCILAGGQGLADDNGEFLMMGV